MGKRNSRSTKSKRSSVSRLPKGLPVRASSSSASAAAAGIISPFENVAKNKRPKHAVHNKNVKGTAGANQQAQRQPQPQQLSALARALERRKMAVKAEIQSKKKANVFHDNRIGEHDNINNHVVMSVQERNLARLVKERSRRSKRSTKYSLQDNDDDNDDGPILTHKGKATDKLTAADHDVILSDDDEDELYGNGGGNLDAEMHFGGGSLSKRHQQQRSIYGPGSGSSGGTDNMTELYSQRKTELDDLILRRKLIKAEKQKSKEEQVEAFEGMDESFQELAGLLQFRNKAEEARLEAQAIRDKRTTNKPAESNDKKKDDNDNDDDMIEWDREMKQYLYMERKVKATDRTKTAEEIALEEAEQLQKLESRRLARMNNDFDDDSLTDILDNDYEEESKKKKKNKSANDNNPEALDNESDSDNDDDDNKLKVRFTPDGLVYIDKNGVVVKKVGEDEEEEEEDKADHDEEEEEEDYDDDDDDEDNTKKETASAAFVVKLDVGTRVKANYHAKEQFQGFESWCDGVIAKVHDESNNNAISTTLYDIEYDDGDYEENVESQYVKPVQTKQKSDEQRKQEAVTKLKRQKAKEKARSEIPYVFEVPTTLDALHDLIGQYASTGEDASTIIIRIHQTNSVKLNKNNLMQMQNFNDVLIRRLIAVGDAIYESGDGGIELGRYKQLDSLTQTMYKIAHDASESAPAVWSRRLGFFHSAHAKRLRDAELENYYDNDDDDSNNQDGPVLRTAWPSTGVFLALRSLGHIFPVTDRRHPVVTPAMLLLGEYVAHTPIRCTYDLVMGVMIAGLLIEYTKEAKRVVPEALAFIAGVIRLYAPKQQQRPEMFPQPSLGAASLEEPFISFRANVLQFDDGEDLPRLSLYRKDIDKQDRMAVAILVAALQLVEGMATNLAGSLSSAENECFYEISSSLLELQPTATKKTKSKSKKNKKESSFPSQIQKKIASAVTAVSNACENANTTTTRQPLQRRPALSARETAIKTLAPRMENPERYSFSKDSKNKKNPKQAALDRTRRELKREHKAISRELRLDATLVEDNRRQERDKKDSAARAKRQKAYAWLEGEQAAMNQQVRQGGGLLQGGGTGAARAKAATGKLGMKKGGKF